MATKYLARTIIEGGRRNTRKRNASHRQERLLTRAFISKANEHPDGFEALSIGVRNKVRKSFADKLGAPRRWLNSQVGRPWDKVRGEIFERFDPRSLAGQHIIFDHMLDDVLVGENHHEYWRRRTLFVDRHGILRAPKPEPKQRFRSAWHLGRITKAISEWLAGRRVGGEGSSLFWLVESHSCDACRNCHRAPCCCPIVDGTHKHGAHKHYRQAQRLSADELEYWESLHEEARCQLRGPREIDK